MDHPNILKLYEIFQDDARYYVVTELCQGGELFDEIVKRQSFSEKDAAQIMYQILSSIVYCHKNKICHRDLKPENVLMEGGENVKVIDFGTAIAFNPDLGMNTMLGTPYYMAPEIFSQSFYDEKCDVWSLGVILYVMLTGRPPFYGASDADVIQKVKIGKYPTESKSYNSVNSCIFIVLKEKGISKEAQELISMMLTRDPRMRISSEEAILNKWV